MSALGGLVVKLALDYAEYTQGLDRSSQEALKFAKNTQGSFDQAGRSAKEYFGNVAGNVAGAVASVVGLSAAFARVHDSIGVLERLDDAAQKTGSSIEDLSRIRQVAANFGDAFDPIEQGITKLAKGLAEIDTPGSDAIRALDAIGVSARDSSGQLRTSGDVYIDVAKSLQEYKDGAEKTAVATALFGKNGADLLPVLNNLAQGIDDVTAISEESTQQANLFNDRMAKSKAAVNGMFMSLAIDLLPTLNNIAGAVNQSTGQVGKFSLVSETAKGVLKGLAIAVYGTVAAFGELGIGIGARAAQLAALAQMDFKGAKFIGQEYAADVARSRAEFSAFVDTVMNGEQKISAAADVGTKKMIDFQLQVPAAVDAATKSVEKQAKAFDMELYLLKEYEKEAARVREITQSVATKQEIYNQKLEELNRLKPQLGVEIYTRALDKAEKELNSVTRSTQTATDEISQMWIQAGRNIQSALGNMVFDFFNGGLDNMVSNVKNAVMRIASEFIGLRISQSLGLANMFTAGGAAAGGGRFGLPSALNIGSMGMSTLSMLRGGFGTMGMIGSGLSALPGTLGAFGAGMQGGSAGAAFIAAESATAGAGAAASMGSAFAAVAGPLMAAFIATQVGRMVAGDKRMGGGFGKALNTVGDIPILGDFIPVVPLMNILFGRGPYKFRQQSLQGTATAGGFDGTMTDVYRSKGGVFLSNKHKEFTNPLTKQIDRMLDSTVKGYSDSIRDFSQNLGRSSDVLDTWSMQVQIKSEKGKHLTEEALNKMIEDIGNDMARKVIPGIDELSRVGESAYATLQRLNNELNVLTSMAPILGRTSSELRGILQFIPFEAKSAFVEMAGGIENLSGLISSYSQNFLTEAERLAPVQEMVNQEMTRLGLGWVTTKEQFKGVMNSFGKVGGVSNETFVALLKVSGAFAQVADSASTATGALQANVDAAKNTLAAAWAEEEARLKNLISQFKGVADSLKNFKNSLLQGNLSPLDPYQKYLQAKSLFESTSKKAQLGDINAAEQLQGVSQAFLEASQGYYASSPQYAADFQAVMGAVEGTESMAVRQVRILERQLAYEQKQVDLLIGIKAELKSFKEALAAAQAAMAALNATKSAPSSAVTIPNNVINAPFQGPLQYDPARAATIRTYVAANSSNLRGIYDAAIAHNVSSGELAAATGVSVQSINDWVRNNGLRSFDVGTNYIPRDMPAMVHKGEEIKPAAYVDLERTERAKTNNYLAQLVTGMYKNAEALGKLNKRMDGVEKQARLRGAAA